jgi:hypothetical protein
MKPLDRRLFLKSTVAGTALAVLPRLPAQSPAAVNPAPGPLKHDDGLERQLLRPLSPLNPKNTEGSGIVLKDGSILLLWTEFMDVDLMPEQDRPPFSPLRKSLRLTPNNDDGYARISGIISKDGGRTWSAPRVYADDADAKVNTMSPALARLPDGRIMLAYSWRSGGNHADNYGPCARRARFSSDEGLTWSDPVRLTPDDGTYHTGCHDRVAAEDGPHVHDHDPSAAHSLHPAPSGPQAPPDRSEKSRDDRARVSCGGCQLMRRPDRSARVRATTIPCGLSRPMNAGLPGPWPRETPGAGFCRHG